MKKTILIVDDEVDVRQLLAELLTAQGYEVVTAGSAMEAYSMLKVASIDLILTDILMPESDGFALHDLIKSFPSLAHIPFVFMSGYLPSMYEATGPIILKPFEMAELTSAFDVCFAAEE